MLNVNQDSVVEAMKFKGPEAEEGFRNLLIMMESDSDLTDLRHAAYMLATTKWECANRWVPIEEFGKGQGKPYGYPVEINNMVAGTVSHVVYYGRGFVQLTWMDNYKKMGQEIGVGMDLLYHPELALVPENAYKIMSHGMRKGMFTGASLSRFIKDTDCNYVNARKIINGLDKADIIAGFAVDFEKLLRDNVIT